MRTPRFSQTVIKELLSLKNLLWIIFFAILYIFTIDVFINYKLLADGLANNFPLTTLLSLLFSLFIGSFTSMSSEPLTFFVLLLNALFVGTNLLLLYKSIAGMSAHGKAHLALGGATVFSIVSAGCASCGLSLLSVLGLSTTLVVLPFHGAELRYISLGLLLLSAFYMLKKLHEAKYCRI